MATIQLTETLLQDGFTAFTADCMKMEDMLPILHQLDQAGYHSIAVWGENCYENLIKNTSTLEQDPWAQLRILRNEMPNTKLLVSLAGQSLFGQGLYADDVVQFFIQQLSKAGIDIVRIHDPLNNILNVEQSIKIALREKLEIQGAICYSLSPVHTHTHYVAYAKQLAKDGVHSLCIVDKAGILSPYTAYELVRDIRSATQLPVYVHSRSNTGLAGMVYLKSAEAGASGLDTSLAPFAEGCSLPSTQGMITALKGSPYATLFDESTLTLAEEYALEKKEELVTPYSFWDSAAFSAEEHQLASEILVAFYNKLDAEDALNHWNNFLKEVALVRKEAGYPSMARPMGQIIAQQAFNNVVMEKRYCKITVEFQNILRGSYGRTPAVPDVAFRQQILGMEQPIVGRAADKLPPDLERLREELPEEFNTQPEDILTLALFPEQAEDFFSQRQRRRRLRESVVQGDTMASTTES